MYEADSDNTFQTEPDLALYSVLLRQSSRGTLIQSTDFFNND